MFADVAGTDTLRRRIKKRERRREEKGGDDTGDQRERSGDDVRGGGGVWDVSHVLSETRIEEVALGIACEDDAGDEGESTRRFRARVEDFRLVPIGSENFHGTTAARCVGEDFAS
jgi:hypothetical protein